MNLRQLLVIAAAEITVIKKKQIFGTEIKKSFAAKSLSIDGFMILSINFYIF